MADSRRGDRKFADLPPGIVQVRLRGTCGATRPLCSLWAVRDQWHWVLANVRRLDEPVPCRGKLGLWRLPGDVEKAVREQLEDDDGAS